MTRSKMLSKDFVSKQRKWFKLANILVELSFSVFDSQSGLQPQYCPQLPSVNEKKI